LLYLSFVCSISLSLLHPRSACLVARHVA
jgi:hypothetical protein